MIKGTLKCTDCQTEQAIEYDDSFTHEMVEDHLSLVNGTSKFFVHHPPTGDPFFSSVCCGAAMTYTIEPIKES